MHIKKKTSIYMRDNREDNIIMTQTVFFIIKI